MRVREPPATSGETIRAIDVACRAFLAGDAKLDPGDTTPAGQQAFARGRLGLVREAESRLTTTRFAPTLEPLHKQVSQLLGEADALYERAETSVDVQPLLEQSQDVLGQLVGAFYTAGAVDCVPSAPSAGPTPPPADAGELLSRRPLATITVGPIGADDNRIVADDQAVWVGLKNLNEMVRIDPRTNTVVATVPLGESPSGAPKIVDGYLWVDTEDDVVRIDPATNQIDRRFHRSDLGFGTSAVDYRSDSLVACVNGTLLVVDNVTGAIRSRVFVAGGCDDLAVDRDRVWVIDDSQKMRRVDTATGASLTPGLPANSSFQPLLFGDGYLWNFGGGRVQRVDPDTGALLGTASRSDMEFIQGCFGGGGLWVASDHEQRAIRFDAHTLRVVELAAGKGVNAIGCSTGTVWVANSDESTVMRFDVSDLG